MNPLESDWRLCLITFELLFNWFLLVGSFALTKSGCMRTFRRVGLYYITAGSLTVHAVHLVCFLCQVFPHFSVFQTPACGSDEREKCLFSLTWNATRSPLKCRLSLTSCYDHHAATGRSGCFAPGDWLGERWYVKWKDRERERVYNGRHGDVLRGWGGWGQENAHTAQASVVLSNSSTAVCECVCVCVWDMHPM